MVNKIISALGALVAVGSAVLGCKAAVDETKNAVTAIKESNANKQGKTNKAHK